jgi:hypothetical protein
MSAELYLSVVMIVRILTLNIRGVRALNTGLSIAMAGKPDVKPILFLAVMTGSDVLGQVRAMKLTVLANTIF